MGHNGDEISHIVTLYNPSRPISGPSMKTHDLLSTPSKGHVRRTGHRSSIQSEPEADCILSRRAQRSFGMLQRYNGHVL